MKRCIVLAMIACMSFGLHAEEQERYILCPTQNMWTFLKLDTETGRIRHVQYGMEQEARFEYVLSELDLTALRGKKYVKGRYKLYPTQNRWTFLLLDTLDGDTFQVQWGKSCAVVPILPGVVKDEEAEAHESKVSGNDTSNGTSGVNIFNLFK